MTRVLFVRPRPGASTRLVATPTRRFWPNSRITSRTVHECLTFGWILEMVCRRFTRKFESARARLAHSLPINWRISALRCHRVAIFFIPQGLQFRTCAMRPSPEIAVVPVSSTERTSSIFGPRPMLCTIMLPPARRRFLVHHDSSAARSAQSRSLDLRRL